MAFSDRVRQVGNYSSAEALQRLAQYRGASDAIDVEISKDRDGFTGSDSCREPGQRGVNAGEGIGGIGYVRRIEEPFERCTVANAA